ncbi:MULTISPECIES: hypothetical protein [Gluconobacter]|uniref:Uncharacterized protein n=1 Tax=Gluconobacter cadivus TaxID=2728101 RepID=A0ABR9YW30_9PROT|nr:MULTISPECIES: hypothetical protein [Gluconobacter]MBF0888750.1 hypothetical protein [Gluconobacter cadivus]MBS1059911.1 hypothetical protein [Gluconobacter sp. Dm-44]
MRRLTIAVISCLSLLLTASEAFAQNFPVERAVNNLGFQTTYQKTISVCASGCDYSSVVAAFTAAVGQAHKLATHGIIVVSVADGAYTETAQAFTNDPASSAVQVIGNTHDLTKVQVNFTHISGTNQSGFIAIGGGQIGLIDGMTINGVGAQASHTNTRTTWKNQSYGAGIMAQGGSVINLGAHMDIEHFYYGVEADDGGVVNARSGGVKAGDAGDVAFMARGNGVIVCTPCTAVRVSDLTNPDTAKLGYCYDAERGGALYIDGSTCSQFGSGGLYALTNGKMWAHGVTVSNPLNTTLAKGAYALTGGVIESQNSTFSGGYIGAEAQDLGVITCNYCTFKGASSDGVVSDGGAFLAGSSVSQNNAGYGYHAIHQGVIRIYGVTAKTTGNTVGKFAADTAGTAHGVAYTAASVFVGN